MITLFRPVGSKELSLIKESDFRFFPSRLPEQPFFYPVLNGQYATQIARDWNAKYDDEKIGYVTKFNVRKKFLDDFESKVVGGTIHEEFWIPAEKLTEFNENIVGKI